MDEKRIAEIRARFAHRQTFSTYLTTSEKSLQNDISQLLDQIEQAQKEIERLKDINSALENDLINANMNLERLTEQVEAQRWIPVSERLPKNNKPVQVYMPKLYMSVQTGFYDRYYGEDDGEWYEHWVAAGEVTRWKELPAPPEES